MLAGTTHEGGLFVEWGAVAGASLAAALCDVRTGRIPNLLTLPVTFLGLVMAAWAGGAAELGLAVLGWVVLALPYMLLFLLGRGGAGDAKLMGALGVWLGLRSGLVVLVCVAGTGAALSVFKLALQPDRCRILRRLAASLYVDLLVCVGHGGNWNLLKPNPQERTPDDPDRLTIPYGLAIFLGVCLGAIVVHLWMP